jgi:hypothetical protein
MKVGSLVEAIDNFDDVRALWNLPYPHKGDRLTVTTIEKHPFHDFYLLTFEEMWTFPLCDRNFIELEIPDGVMEDIESFSLAGQQNVERVEENIEKLHVDISKTRKHMQEILKQTKS